MKNYTILLIAVSILLSACGPSAPCDHDCMARKYSDDIFNSQQRANRAAEDLKKSIADAAAAGFGTSTKNTESDFTEVCVNHNMYLQFPTGVTVEYDENGHVKACS